MVDKSEPIAISDADFQPAEVPAAAVGQIIASALSPADIAKVHPKFFRVWQPADGRAAPTDSMYAYIKGAGSPLPDLRAVFLRGLNQFDGGQSPVDADRADPDARGALSYQADAIQNHRHDTELSGGSAGMHDSQTGSGPKRRAAAASYKDERVLLNLGVSNDPSGGTVRPSIETRPKNVAVYYYIRINI